MIMRFMNKKIFSCVICFLVCALMFSFNTYAEEAVVSGNSEEIENNPVYVAINLIDRIKPTFKEVDISGVANRAFKDDVEGDGVGGWSDQGDNDLRNYTEYGNVKYRGIPFNIINPAKNGNKSCIVLRGRNDMNVPNEVAVDIGTYAKGVYILHAGAWVTEGEVGGTYTYEYEDGTSAYFNAIVGTHVGNFWGTIDQTSAKVAWQGSNAQTDCISFSIFALSNPHPDKLIKSIKINTDGSTNYLMVVGMTLAKDALYFDDGGKGVINSDSWLPIETVSNRIASGSVLDASVFLDKPAGKYGAIKAQGDGFVFENGKSAKLWGTNLVGKACFAEKEQADTLAELIAKCGFNVVRMSDIDDIIFDSSGSIQSDKADKLMYLISKLKENGVYTYLSVVSGKTAAGFYAEEKVDGEISRIKSVLSLNNPYTGMTLASDPALAFVEGIDDISSLDFTYSNSAGKVTQQEYLLLQNRFTEFLKNKYKTTAALKRAWKYDGENGLGSSENLESGTVMITDLWKNSLYTDERKSDTAEFFVSLQLEFNTRLKNALGEIGYKGVFTGNSNKLSDIYRWSNKEKVKDALTLADVYANSETDFVARKAVMSYPYGGYVSSPERKLFFHSNDSVLRQRDGGIIGEFSKNRVLGKPYVVAAYNSAFPNSYLAEVLPVMAIFSARNGWTSLNYAFAVDELKSESFMNDVYSMYNNPVRMALASTAARIFYTTDESSKVYENNMQMKDVFLGNSDLNVTNEMLLGGKYGVTFSKANKRKGTITHGANSEYITDKSLYWNTSEGVFRFKNDFCDVLAGDMLKKRSSDNYDVDLVAANAVAALASCDGNKISDSKRLLLTVAGGATNSGYKTDQDMVDFGSAPVKLETILGNITLKIPGSWEIYVVDGTGNRKSKLAVNKQSNGYTTFKINSDYQNSETRGVNFEIVKVQ